MDDPVVASSVGVDSSTGADDEPDGVFSIARAAMTKQHAKGDLPAIESLELATEAGAFRLFYFGWR